MIIRVQKLIAWVSVLLLVIKFWAYLLTNSVALLTDALESIVNVFTGFFGLYSVHMAARPRDNDHPYGHGKIEFISAGIEGGLILMAGIIIIYQSFKSLLHPHPLLSLDMGSALILATALVNFILGRYAVLKAKPHGSITLAAAGKHLLTDAYSTFALVLGLLLLRFTGWHFIDSLIALGMALFLFRTGFKLLRKSIGGIMDEADVVVVESLIALLQKHRQPYWIDLHNLRVQQFGSSLHLDAHLTLPWYYNVKQADAVTHEIESLLAAGYKNEAEVFLHIDACQPYSCAICSMPNCEVRQQPLQKLLVWDASLLWKDGKHGKN